LSKTTARPEKGVPQGLRGASGGALARALRAHQRPLPRALRPLATALLLALAWCWLWSQLHGGLGRIYSPDAIGYNLLGRSLTHGRGYSVDYCRDFYAEPRWPLPNRAFPPLYPLVVGITDRLLELGLPAGPAANLVVLLGTLALLAWPLRRLAPAQAWLLPAAYLWFFAHDAGYRGEAVAGRAIPLTMMLFLAFAVAADRLLASSRPPRRAALLAGVGLAALPLTRFDQLAFCLATFPLLLGALARRLGSWRAAIRPMLLVLAAFSLTMAPWALRNTLRFGRPFASDNWPMIFSTYASETHLSYWIPGQEPPTLRTDPGLWVRQRLGYAQRNLRTLAHTAGPLLALAPLALLASWGALGRRRRLFASLALLQTVATFATVSLTPYPDPRFFAPTHLWLTLLLALALAAALGRWLPRARWRRLTQALGLLGLLVLGGRSGDWEAVRGGLLRGQIIPHGPEEVASHYVPLVAAFGRFVPRGSVVAIYGAEHLNYFTGFRAIYLPTNIARRAHFLAWIARWRVGFLIMHEPAARELGLASFALTQAAGTDLLLIDAAAFARSAGVGWASRPAPAAAGH